MSESYPESYPRPVRRGPVHPTLPSTAGAASMHTVMQTTSTIRLNHGECRVECVVCKDSHHTLLPSAIPRHLHPSCDQPHATGFGGALRASAATWVQRVSRLLVCNACNVTITAFVRHFVDATLVELTWAVRGKPTRRSSRWQW